VLGGYDKGGRWQSSLALLAHLGEIGLAPDEISYNSALSALEKGHKWPEAIGILSLTMPQRGATPDEISFNSAMSACEKNGQWQMALSMMLRMPRVRLTPDSITYNVVITASSRAS
ncbi:unnamed protein product, partial [Polarella glacialis]